MTEHVEPHDCQDRYGAVATGDPCIICHPDEPPYNPMRHRPPEGEEYGGQDWSYQRQVATDGIHAIHCMGWEPIDGRPDQFVHICRSAAGNALGLLFHAGQLLPDNFAKPIRNND